MEPENVVKELIKLLKEKPYLRRELSVILSEAFPTRDEYLTIIKELKALREDFNKIYIEFSRRFEEINKRFEDVNKRFEDVNRRFEDVNKRFEVVFRILQELRVDLHRGITAIGARWGIFAEEAFRGAMRGVVEELGYGAVERWLCYDDKGVVKGYPARVEVDLCIKDGVHYLVEVKSSVSAGDVAKFMRVGRLYEEEVKVKPRLVMVTPFIDDEGLEAAKTLNVKVYTRIWSGRSETFSEES